jgi:hypothetical protein
LNTCDNDAVEIFLDSLLAGDPTWPPRFGRNERLDQFLIEDDEIDAIRSIVDHYLGSLGSEYLRLLDRCFITGYYHPEQRPTHADLAHALSQIIDTM